ncbi:MAG: ribonuclease E activity regulator RraA [Gammaproteobacteria bacterium]|jgi:regulator of ribonuclease activity A
MPHHTADLCDAHEADLHVLEPLFEAFGSVTVFDGPIATVKCYEDNSKVREALAEPGAGRVLVVDGGGSMRRALLGDMLAEMAVKNGWQGLVINGCIRDSAAINELELGVRALGTIPLKTHKRGEGQRDVSLSFAGVTFRPGEHLYADADGVVVAARPLDLAGE